MFKTFFFMVFIISFRIGRVNDCSFGNLIFSAGSCSFYPFSGGTTSYYVIGVSLGYRYPEHYVSLFFISGAIVLNFSKTLMKFRLKPSFADIKNSKFVKIDSSSYVYKD